MCFKVTVLRWERGDPLFACQKYSYTWNLVLAHWISLVASKANLIKSTQIFNISNRRVSLYTARSTFYRIDIFYITHIRLSFTHKVFIIINVDVVIILINSHNDSYMKTTRTKSSDVLISMVFKVLYYGSAHCHNVQLNVDLIQC